jgi:acid phosphatase type 7
VLAIVAVLLAVADGCGSDSNGGGAGNRKPAVPESVPSDTKARAVVWAVGDGANGSQTARRVARMIERDRPDRFLYLGDVYPEGTAEKFAENYDPVYGGLAERTAPTPGNHEWFNHADGYGPYWKKKHGRAPRPYYSFRTGSWQIISLNSETEHGSESPQVAWLRSQVRSGGTCRLAFWHRPRYSAGDRHGDQPDVQPFWDALEGRAAIVVNGHEHDMQRFERRRGITQLVSGAGGNELYDVDERDDLAFGNSETFGALRLELSAGQATYRFVSVKGRTLDSGKLSCNPA